MEQIRYLLWVRNLVGLAYSVIQPGIIYVLGYPISSRYAGLGHDALWILSCRNMAYNNPAGEEMLLYPYMDKYATAR